MDSKAVIKGINRFYLPILIIFGIAAVFYFKFTAEDAYITVRYGENLIETGAPVYNIGEQINVTTSPLHVLISAFLFKITAATVLSNKILSFILLIISTLLVWFQFKKHSKLQVIAVSLLLLPPCFLLWAFGGLETLLLLFLITLITTILYKGTPYSVIQLCLVFFLAGLIFVTRYDAVLFLAPLVLYASMKSRSLKNISLALTIGAILPVLWILFSLTYYGSIFPTSFFVKTPEVSIFNVGKNGLYISFYLFFTGLIPCLILYALLIRNKINIFSALSRHMTRLWWLYSAVLLELTYGLTMATHHMMFSFRFFVPYIPAAVILVMDLFGQTDEIDFNSRKSTQAIFGFLVFLVLFQMIQIIYTYKHSLNGLSPVGEYNSLSLHDYSTDFLPTLKKQSEDIKRHWDGIKLEKNRPPRISTFAGGLLPYSYREAYIYEILVSYRHGPSCEVDLSADYIHILAPRHGKVSQQLPLPEEDYSLISDYELVFDGIVERFLVYYNPTPESHRLGKNIHEECR